MSLTSPRSTGTSRRLAAALLVALALDGAASATLAGAAFALPDRPVIALCAVTALAGVAGAAFAVPLAARRLRDGTRGLTLPAAVVSFGLVENTAGCLGALALYPDEPVAVALLIGGTVITLAYLALMVAGARTLPVRR